MSTHHLRNSSTLLDLCIIDDGIKLKEFGQSGVAFLSVHDLIFIRYGIKLQRHHGRLAVCRDWSGFDAASFQSDIEIFGTKLLNIFNAHVPLKRQYFKNLSTPWLIDEIRLVMRNKDLARRTWRRHKNDIKAQYLVRSAKREYYANIFNQEDKASKVWKRLRHLGMIKARDTVVRLSYSVEELNAFFVHNAECADCMERGSLGVMFAGDFDDRSFHWNYVVPRNIVRVISRAKSNAVGGDISLRVLKLTIHGILPILEHLSNFSLINGVFPVKWKSALICPIPKVNNPTLVQYYRPISILPILSKALEWIVCTQIRAYLEGSVLYDPCQSAYRNNYSTQNCLIRMLDDVRHADRRMVTVCIF
ncbi:hypothetical protein ACFW04_014002 [Cataglyphis niger]